MRGERTSYVPHLLLTSLIAIWAGSFVVAKVTMITITPFALVTSRFVIGSLCVLPFFLRTPRAQRRSTFVPGVIAGLVLAVPYFLQMYGVRETTASMGGFVTGAIVLLVAVGGALFFGARLGPATVLALLIGVTGIVTLCMAGDVPAVDGAQTNGLRGVLLQLGSAVGFAAHILLLSHYGKKLPTAPFAFWQLAFTGALAGVGTLVSGVTMDGEPVEWTPDLLLELGYLGVLATGLAIVVQAKVQPRVQPTHVALLFALQPLFTALAGWLFLGDRLGAAQWLGGGLIVSAVVIAARDQR